MEKSRRGCLYVPSRGHSGIMLDLALALLEVFIFGDLPLAFSEGDYLYSYILSMAGGKS